MAKDDNLDHRPPGKPPPMSAAQPSSYIAQSHREHHPESRPRSPQRRRTKLPRGKQPTHAAGEEKGSTHHEDEDDDEDDDEGWFAVRGIIGEKKSGRGKIYYLVDWEGADKNGEPHKPSWEPERNLTAAAIIAWEEEREKVATASPSKSKAKAKANSSPVADHKVTPTLQKPDVWDSDSIQPSTRRRQDREKKRPFQDQADQVPESGKEGSNKRRLTKSLLKSSNRDRRAPTPSGSLFRKPTRLSGNNSGKSSLNSRGKLDHRRTHILAGPSRNRLSNVDRDLSVPLDSQQTGSQQSFQSTHAHTTAPRQSELGTEDQRVIPDSQALSGFSVSEAQDSVPSSPTLLRISQVQGQVVTASRRSFQSSLSLSTEIPSRQPDHPLGTSIGNLSASAFIIGTSVGSTGPADSQNARSRGYPSFSTQGSFNLNLALPTSRPGSFTSTIGPKSTSDEHISAASVSQNQNQNQTPINGDSAESQQSSSQAAQVVAPLNSQQGGLATHSQVFTVYDDDSVRPSATSRNLGSQHDSQGSSQALSELDGNTRSASFSKSHQAESELVPSHIELLQSPPKGLVNSIEGSERPAGQLGSITSSRSDRLPATSQPAAHADMDGGQHTPLSARERLRAIRQATFADLDETFAVSPDSRGADASVGPSTAAQVSVQEAQVVQPPASRDISPLTPVQLTSPSFLAQSRESAANASSSDAQQSMVPENMQPPASPEKEAGLRVEGGDPVGAAYSAHEEPITLDPSALTLSIEHDMDVSPSLPAHDALPSSLQLPDEFDIPHEEAETPPDYPRSLLPYIPTGPNEYLITLPFYNSFRPVYNDVIRDNIGLISEYSASFSVSPHQEPHPATVSKLDEMFSRLFDLCDLPPFMEITPSMTPSEITRHVIGTNAKFAFVTELLVLLAELNSDKKILILARPGKVMDFLGDVIETKGYRYIRSGVEIVGPLTAKHALTVAISSTADKPSSIPEDVDAVIAFDHTYQPELLPPAVRERSRLLLVLTNTCSIQHLNMRISENLDPLERKNILALALVKAMRYIEDVDESLITKLDVAAVTFSKYIQDPDDDDFYWEPQEVPEDVFEDLHNTNSGELAPQSVLGSLGTDQLPGSRKRSHGDEDNETSSKRLRVSQPTVVTHVSHISDSLKNLIGDDLADESPKATLSISVSKLEALSSKITSLEAGLAESKEREMQFRQLSDRTKREVDDYASTVNIVQQKYMVALKDRGTYEDNYYKAKEEALGAAASLESSHKENEELKQKVAELQGQLAAAKESLLKSSNPDLVRMVRLEGELEESKLKVQQLEKKATLAWNDMEYAKEAYQSAAQRAGELQSENRLLQRRVEELARKAEANVVEVNRIYAASETNELLRMINEQKSIVRDRETELGRVKDELKTLKESRRGTRQSSVPRSPRLSAFGVNSPRNGGRAKGSSSSRGTSPAPATGIFETGAGNGTPAPNNRASHLRESSRF